MSGDWIEVSVARRWREAVDVVGFELTACDGAALPAFEAGAHIDVVVPGRGVRSYSLANDAAESHRYVIAVLRDPRGRGGSLALCDRIGTGDRLRIRSPRNDFPMRLYAVHSVLLAGGIGIAPLHSMAAHLWRRGAPFALHYIASNPSRAAFNADLHRCPYRSHVRFYSSEAQGRLNIGDVLQQMPASADVYACGPDSFMRSVAAAFADTRRTTDRLHFESFKL